MRKIRNLKNVLFFTVKNLAFKEHDDDQQTKPLLIFFKLMFRSSAARAILFILVYIGVN